MILIDDHSYFQILANTQAGKPESIVLGSCLLLNLSGSAQSASQDGKITSESMYVVRCDGNEIGNNNSSSSRG